MATHTDAISQVYAQSLFDLAHQAGGLEKVDEIADELQQICGLIHEDKQFAEFIASPIINKTRRGDALKNILSDRITDLTLRFLLVVNTRDRLGHLLSIAAAYQAMLQDAHGRIEVDVHAAAQLDETQLAHVKQRITEALGKEPVITAHVDASMLGGLRLRIGDRLVDGSISTALRRLRERMLADGSSTVRERADQIIEEQA